MRYRVIPFKDLCDHYNMTEDELLQKPYIELENMSDAMLHEKARDEVARNAKDERFRDLVTTFLRGYDFLRTWWSEDEIVEAAARHMTERDLVEEYPARGGCDCPIEPNEYVGEKWVTLPRYTKDGERLMEGERKKCHVFLIANRYQGTRFGGIVLDLLYGAYPELERYGFSAYGFDQVDRYELYPANNVYTPLAALMEGDVDAIVERNVGYAKSYNGGAHTPEKTEERLASDEVQEYLDTIRNLKRKEG